jgi:hypothetical protein
MLGFHRIKHGYFIRRVTLSRSAGQSQVSSAVWWMCSWFLKVAQPVRTVGSAVRPASAAAARRRRSRLKASCAAYMKVKSTLPGRGCLPDGIRWPVFLVVIGTPPYELLSRS